MVSQNMELDDNVLINRKVWNAQCIEVSRLREQLERIKKSNMCITWLLNSTDENFARIHDAVFAIVYGEERNGEDKEGTKA